VTAPHASRLIATASLVLALAACTAPAAEQAPPDTVGWEHAVPVPSVAPDAPAGDFPACGTDPAAAGSPAALAYVEAVNASTPAWTAIDQKIHDAGEQIYFDDLTSQIASDEPFVAAVEAVEFPADAAPVAADLVAAVRAYDDYLRATLQAGDFSDDYRETSLGLKEERAQSSSRLRDVLNLPEGPCWYLRP
jgi:hypothetical protein